MGAVERVQFEAPQRAGQATMVEQSRAVAEVQAAVVVAQQIPRVTSDSLREMRESCAQMGLAERAFFSFPRSGKVVQGPSVHLARELARCWGNVQYGVAELRRDDREGVSEMQAWAWDVQTNTRSSQTFIVPHKRDKRDGPEALRDMRDIYENNANQGARRLREAIFNVLPPWFTDEAQGLCHATLRDGGGKPVSQRIADAVAKYDSLGVSVADLEASVGRAQKDWTAHDVSQLGVKFKSIERGEATIGELFPRERQSEVVSVAEIAAQQAPQLPEPVETPAEVETPLDWLSPLDDAKRQMTALREAGKASEARDALTAAGLPTAASKWTDDHAPAVLDVLTGIGR